MLSMLHADHLEHLVEGDVLAWASVLLRGHVGEGSPVVGPRRVEGHNLEAGAAPAEEQFLLENTNEENVIYRFTCIINVL